jgi:hypothetical protein
MWVTWQLLKIAQIDKMCMPDTELGLWTERYQAVVYGPPVVEHLGQMQKGQMNMREHAQSRDNRAAVRYTCSYCAAFFDPVVPEHESNPSIPCKSISVYLIQPYHLHCDRGKGFYVDAYPTNCAMADSKQCSSTLPSDWQAACRLHCYKYSSKDNRLCSTLSHI